MFATLFLRRSIFFRFLLLPLASLVGFAPHAHAQSGAIPSYIESLAPYEVRRLDGTFAPSNGNLSIRDVTPGEWISNDPGSMGLAGVIAAWNGGAKGIGTRLFVHGGGHTDSANNGVYTFDFSGSSRPTGWLSPLSISSVSAVRDGGDTYSDGRPNAVHTYDGAVYADHNNYIYRFTGSKWRNGFMMNGAFKFNVATSTWSTVPEYPGYAGGAKTLYDSGSGKIFVTMNDALEGYFFRTNNDTWSGSKSYSGNGFPFNSMGAWDSSRGRGIIVGDNEKSLVTIDFQSESVSVSGFSASGDTEILGRGGISAVYDSVADVYWIFGGADNSVGWSNIYQMNADGPPWIIQAHSFTGSSIVRNSQMIGSWGRYVFMPQWRALGVVASETSPAFIIRLPGEVENVVEPRSPTEMEAQ